MFEARPTQTKVKHIILEQYLKSWGGIITFGARQGIQKAIEQGRSAGIHFVYVDAFAGHGLYEGELEDKERGKTLTPVPGSPIIGLQALDSLVESGRKVGVPIRVNAVLIEEEKEAFNQLKTSLELTGYSTRTKITTNFHSLQDQEIAVVRSDSTLIVNELLAYTKSSKYMYAFYLLDPYGPKGIPLRNISQIISQERHDTLINMPYQDLHKKKGILGKNDLSSTEASLIKNYDEMFGGTGWHQIVKQWMETQPGSRQSQDLELNLANFYGDVLRSVDDDLSIKSLPLRFSDKERTMFHLYLTTHDPTGAIRMNQLIVDANIAEHFLRWELRYAKMTQGGQQMSMFSPSEIAPPIQQIQNDYTNDIASKIITAFSGKTTTQKQIYRLLADELYTPGEITKALGHLKKTGKATFESSPKELKHNTRILIL